MATLAELRDRVLIPIDMQSLDMVTQSEVNQYINDGIKEAEARIHNLYEDYFLRSVTLDQLTSDSNGLYTLPDDIYARKIRRIIFKDSANNYMLVKQVRNLDDIGYISDSTNAVDDYVYIILNEEEPKIKFYPDIDSSDESNITLYYLRDALQLTVDSDEIDIPEFEQFVVNYAKIKCLEKENDPDSILLKRVVEDYVKSLQLMEDTLANSIPDEDSELLQDTQFYLDFDNFYTDSGQYE